jgi:hypothetical protein
LILGPLIRESLLRKKKTTLKKWVEKISENLIKICALVERMGSLPQKYDSPGIRKE